MAPDTTAAGTTAADETDAPPATGGPGGPPPTASGRPPRPEKVAVVAEIGEKLADADAVVLLEYRGLRVGELAELRAQLRPTGTEFKVFKNTLARRAAAAAQRTELLDLLIGPTAIAFVRGDAVGAAKALRGYARANPGLVIKGGVLGPRLLRPAEVDALADVPPREELLARLAGGFHAPLQRAAGLFQSFTRGFATALAALVDQRGGAPPDVRADEGPAAPTGEAGATPTAEAEAEPAPADAPAAQPPPTEAG